MVESVFHTVGVYLRDVFWMLRSVWGACTTAIPYLFGSKDLTREVTEQYPDPISSRTADDLPSRSRGFLINHIDKCIGCKACEQICPTQCIRVEAEPMVDETKSWVSVFDINFSKCIFCGLCVDVCQPGSLVHTKRYEGAVLDLHDLIVGFGRGEVTPEQREWWATVRQSERL